MSKRPLNKIPHYVIVGNGPAGNAAAVKLREEAPQARITIICDEPFHFYNRCRLPEFAAGGIEENELQLKTTADYKALDIELRLGQKMIDIDTAGKSMLLDHRERIHFDEAILATGGKPRMPERLHDCGAQIHTLKNLLEARRWKELLKDGESVLLIGGDLVSIRFARCLAKAGKKVTISLWEEAFWPLKLTDELRNRITASLGKQGVTVRDDLPFTGCEPSSSGRGTTCFFQDGGQESFDIVGGFFGYEPEVSVLGHTGLQLDRGILVDEHLRTNMAGVYAAGDAAQVYNPEIADYWVSIGWKNATLLGELAACNLLGYDTEAKEGDRSYLTIEGVKVNTSWWVEV